MTESDRPKAKPRKPKLYRFVPLPPGFHPVICTFDEACSYARCSRWTGHQKVKQGRWRTFKDGRVRKVEFDSVVEDVERIRTESGIKPPEPMGKRRPGRPKAKAGAGV
jgi:hypothetical protein